MKRLITLITFVLAFVLASCSTVHTQLRDDNHLLVTSFDTEYGQFSCIRGLCCFPYKHRGEVGDKPYAMVCVDEKLVAPDGTLLLNVQEVDAYLKVYIP